MSIVTTHTHTYKTNTSKRKIKLFEAFAGIGSQYKALKNIENQLNWNVEHAGIIEWYIPAIIAYQAIHFHFDINKISKKNFNYLTNLSTDSKKPVSKEWFLKNTQNSILGYWLTESKEKARNYFDITKVKGQQLDKDIDIFTYSFPCQDISNQGKQKGFQKGSETRSGLLWEIGRILKELGEKNLPKYLLLENVKSIFDKNHFKTYLEWEKELENLGYVSKRYVLNSLNFGSAQNRQRAFVISVLKTHKANVGYDFPDLESIKIKNPKILKDILSKQNEFNPIFNKYELKEKSVNKSNNVHKYELLNYTKFNSENFVYDINYSGPTLTASGALSRIKLIFGKDKIREMSSEECFKYMGFEKKDYKKVLKTNLINKNKMIFLCGNSISVEVLETIFKGMKF